MLWMESVKMVKDKIAKKRVSYSQSKYTTISYKGNEKSTRRDCSGYVSSCLYYYGIVPKSFTTSSWGFSKSADVEKLLIKGGFKKMKFISWDNLKEGDIISQSHSHVEIFSHNAGSIHYVYSNGKTSDMYSSIPTPDSGKHKYDTVWRLTKEPVDKFTKSTFIKEVQAAAGLTVDGKVSLTLVNKTITISSGTNNRHYLVYPLQKYFNLLGYKEIGKIDGEAGSKFTATVKKYQKDKGLPVVDGKISAKANTWKKLLGL